MGSAQSAVSGVFDLAVVGAGIIGLSCARAAAQKGLRVIVIDRDAQANGASVRNFGLVVVAGQQRGTAWNRARRSCEIWRQVAEQAAIPILQRGLWLTTRRPEALGILEAFLKTEMGEGCEILSPAAARARCSKLVAQDVQAVLVSADSLSVEPPRLETPRGVVQAGAVAVCPGDDLSGLYAARIANYHVTRCKLQMLRLASPGFSLPAALMSDLGLLRYAGYSALPEAAPLRARLEAEQREHLEHGIHLIVAQSADGTLVVGDSHHYAATPDPFADERVDQLILEEFAAATGRLAPAVLERWTGTYASAADAMFIDAPAPDVRLVMVTGGSGASTGFALGEEVIAGLFGGGAA
jgi:glycine/D-amino acid oxidase-like deaminating enzyme